MTPQKPMIVADYLESGCGRCPLGGTPDCKVHAWQAELAQLRKIALASGLTEEIKWGVPCYTLDGKNIFLLSALKSYSVMSFFKGALMQDPHGVLVKPGKNSQADRQVQFTEAQTVIDMAPIWQAYIQEAIEIEKAGLKVEYKETSQFDFPDELLRLFEDDPAFAAAFDVLTPGRQRGYLLHFSSAKQSKTRVRRIEKYMPRIFEGKGLHDH